MSARQPQVAATRCSRCARIRRSATDSRGGDALPDELREFQRVVRIHDLDRRRVLLQKARFPAARLRRVRAGRVLQPEGVITSLQAPLNRDERRILTNRVGRGFRVIFGVRFHVISRRLRGFRRPGVSSRRGRRACPRIWSGDLCHGLHGVERHERRIFSRRCGVRRHRCARAIGLLRGAAYTDERCDSHRASDPAHNPSVDAR